MRRIRGYGDGESFRAAVEGVDSLFLVSAAEHPNRVRLHVSAVDAAIDAGVGSLALTLRTTGRFD